MESDEEKHLSKEYEEKIAEGNSLLDKISGLSNSDIHGVDKLRNKIKRELAFLTKAECSGKLKREHILCTNLHHLGAVVEKVVGARECTSVLEGFHFLPGQTMTTSEDDTVDDKSKRLSVDIVSDRKRKWTKVIARNPKALTLISRGEGEFGQKSVIDQAEEYVNCARQNLHLFKPPVVEFHFACGIEEDLAKELLETGVLVSGTIINSNDDISDSSVLTSSIMERLQLSNEKEEEVHLNLDTSTMIVYVSALTNGHLKRRLRSRVLTQQAQWEKERPVKPVLDRLFKGRKMFACESAVRSFKSIVELLGGEGEKARASELLSRVSVVPDCVGPCARLRVGGQIKKKSLPVFGTGLTIKAVTVTANGGFVRAASKQGLNIDVFIHESRALTERNEIED